MYTPSPNGFDPDIFLRTAAETLGAPVGVNSSADMPSVFMLIICVGKKEKKNTKSEEFEGK
jgi:hypothetical protein